MINYTGIAAFVAGVYALVLTVFMFLWRNERESLKIAIAIKDQLIEAHRTHSQNLRAENWRLINRLQNYDATRRKRE